MRNVILYMSMSLDGLVDSDREHPGMAIPEGAELKQWKLDRISQAGAHLMGRTTYEQMSSAWPHSDDPYAAPMNDIPKVVFSTAGARCSTNCRSPATCLWSRPSRSPTASSYTPTAPEALSRGRRSGPGRTTRGAGWRRSGGLRVLPSTGGAHRRGW
jgi:hypothetical protein